jgi:motility quorum-sensing regulator/GCU-specific mRNA interferase toxin
MEKHTPQYPLSEVKACIQAGRVRASTTAIANAAILNFDFLGMVAVVESLTMQDFYKSMTSYRDHREWHDVYRPQTNVGEVYLKLTIVEGLLIVSFKEL